MPIFRLSDTPDFPPVQLADNFGLLAIGGELNTEWILKAYRKGIFPWFSEGEPIMWWSPNPRMVLFPENLKVRRSMRNVLNQEKFTVRFDTNFKQVIEACAAIPRQGEYGTWITADMIEAYTSLHEMGVAHSVEVYNRQNELVGGLYGLAIGTCFFGESMFSRESNASKVGFIKLVKWLEEHNYSLIDCQVSSGHLQSLGAEEIERALFIQLVSENIDENGVAGKWKFD